MKQTVHFIGPYCCMKCKAIKDASQFPIRWDLVTPVIRKVCKDCRRKAQNLYRHGREELNLPLPEVVVLDGFLPMGPVLDRPCLVASLGCVVERRRAA